MATVGVKVAFNQEIERVWEVLTSVDQFKTWRSDLKEVDILDEKRYVESTKDGYVTSFTVLKSEPCERLILDTENENLKGQWIIRLSKCKYGTELSLQETANAHKIYMQMFARTYIRSRQLAYIEDLKKILE